MSDKTSVTLSSFTLVRDGKTVAYGGTDRAAADRLAASFADSVEVVESATTYRVGDRVYVRSFSRWRLGVVTKLGRTRVTVDHEVNQSTGRRVVKAFGPLDVQEA